MDVTPKQVEAGHAVYTKRFLRIYDLQVLRFLNHFVYRCTSSRLLDHYNAHISRNHLDVGVGTGFFLDRCTFAEGPVRLALMDLNTDCLDVASRRLARFQPETYRANVLEPIHINGAKFDSVAMNYLLHCLPGNIRTKAVVFEHLKALLNPGGVIFGATMLFDGARVSRSARRFMKELNKRGIMTNTEDDLDGLTWVLEQHLHDPTVEIVGSAALFSGRV